MTMTGCRLFKILNIVYLRYKAAISHEGEVSWTESSI